MHLAHAKHRVRFATRSARPLDNAVLDKMLLDIRTRTGNTVINRQGAVRKVLRELQANRAVAARDLQIARARVALLKHLPIGVR